MASAERDLIVRVDHEDEIVVINPKTFEQNSINVDEICDQINTAKELCDLLGDVLPLQRIKAILFVIVSTNFPSFKEANDFRLGCHVFCQKNDIFFVSVPFTTLEAIFATSETKTTVEEGEHVLVAFSIMPGFPSGMTLLRENGRYRIQKYNRSQHFMFTDEWKEEFFGTFNYKKVILVHNASSDCEEEMEMYEEFFEDYNAVTITQGPERDLLSKATVEKVLHLMGEKISQYDVSPPCLNEYFIHIDSNVVMKALIYADPLPFEKSVVIPVKAAKLLSFYVRTETYGRRTLLQEIDLSPFKFKKIKIALKVDVNALHDLNVEVIDEKNLDENCSKMKNQEISDPRSDKGAADLIQKLYENAKITYPRFSDLKARIVFRKQTFAVFLKENDSFRMLENDGDIDGIPIYIAFTEEKPIVGQAAKELYNKYTKNVVFDIVKLCSLSNEDVMSPKWGFRLLKEKDALMVCVQTPEGEKKSAVDLFLAIILRHALKIIKDETGKKLEQVEIQFCSFVANDVLKQTFVNAGKHMNLDIDFC